MTAFLHIILASSISLASGLGIEPENPPVVAETDHAQATEQEAPFASAGELLAAIGKQDILTDSLTGNIRYIVINALENDRQTRYGKLAIQKQPGSDQRNYAVSFDTLVIDDRQESIAEHYIFDGRWFIERKPQEKQFNKRELVPMGQTLDPMELMRDAPFWVSLGHDQERLLASYNAELLPTTQSLIENADFPELAFFAELPHVSDTVQLKLTPKPGSGFEDDWEWVRIWINPETLQPSLYIKSEWTGDLQIVDLFSLKANNEIPASVFDTTTPDARSGWRVQISEWRGQE
jgi:hypothetical protein